jgi:hypothetical protein
MMGKRLFEEEAENVVERYKNDELEYQEALNELEQIEENAYDRADNPEPDGDITYSMSQHVEELTEIYKNNHYGFDDRGVAQLKHFFKVDSIDELPQFILNMDKPWSVWWVKSLLDAFNQEFLSWDKAYGAKETLQNQKEQVIDLEPDNKEDVEKLYKYLKPRLRERVKDD